MVDLIRGRVLRLGFRSDNTGRFQAPAVSGHYCRLAACFGNRPRSLCQSFDAPSHADRRKRLFCIGLVFYAAFREGYTLRNLVLLAVSVAVALYQSLEMTQWNRENYGVDYSDLIVAASCLVIVAIIALAIKRQRSLLPGSTMLALGGIQLPLYLLHQHIGCVMFSKVGTTASPEAVVAVTVLLLICVSYLLWRFFDEPSRRLASSILTRLFENGFYLPRPKKGASGAE